MDPIEKTLALNADPIFTSINLDELLLITNTLEEQFFKSGFTIFQEGDSDTFSYLLVKGSVKCFSKKWSTFIYPPYFFGEESSLTGFSRQYSAKCEKETKCLIIPGETFRNSILRNPEIALRILERNKSSHLATTQ